MQQLKISKTQMNYKIRLLIAYFKKQINWVCLLMWALTMEQLWKKLNKSYKRARLNKRQQRLTKQTQRLGRRKRNKKMKMLKIIQIVKMMNYMTKLQIQQMILKMLVLMKLSTMKLFQLSARFVGTLSIIQILLIRTRKFQLTKKKLQNQLQEFGLQVRNMRLKQRKLNEIASYRHY